MRNQAVNLFSTQQTDSWSARKALRTDQNPLFRLLTLYGLFLIVVGIIASRMFFIQSEMADDYASLFDQPDQVYTESLPGLNGRILTRDGLVLAEDRQTLQVTAHYRWLETPANQNWLNRRVRERLSRAERRDKERIEQTKEEILQEREQMWQSLSELTGKPLEQITLSRQKIQNMIERRRQSVAKRREERASAQENLIQPNPESQNSFEKLTAKLKKTLTTSPKRAEQDPLVIAEELDYHPILENVTRQIATEIKADTARFPGLDIQRLTERHYPQRELAAHVIGRRKKLTTEEFQARQEKLDGHDPFDYQIGDRIGISGLELQYDRQLRGLRGERTIIKNKFGEILSDKITRDPQHGRDVIITLDGQLQRALQQTLEKKLQLGPTSKKPDEPQNVNKVSPPKGGAIVVLDVRTGAVIAAASAPTFDLELVSHPEENPSQYNALNRDIRSPFMNRCIKMAVAPGSVFKTMTSMAIMESGQWNPDEPLYCQGYLHEPHRYRCYSYTHYGHGHGDMTLVDSLCQSCNVYFFTAAEELSATPILKWSRKLGIGQKTGVDLPGESRGNLPDLKPGDVGYSGNARGLAIGQSQLTTTPMQIARMMAFVANDGELVTPYLAEQVGSYGQSRIEHRPVNLVKIPGAEHAMLDRVREGLTMVVQNPRGTGYKRVRLDEVQIAGKTGTAEVGPGKKDHAWFAGFVPADRPKYAFAVVLEHGGTGGSNAGPVAKEMVQSMLNLGLLGNSRLKTASK